MKPPDERDEKTRNLSAELETLLRKGASARQIQEVFTRASQLPGEPELLRRLALARSFDQNLFGRLSEGLTVRPLAEFANQPAVESSAASSCAASSPPSYAIQESQRADLLSKWTAGSPELKISAQQLLASYSPDTAPIDRMSAQILANPAEGQREFEALYKQADDRFDISECSLLIQILRTRNLLLSNELRTAWQSKQDYLNSRILFADDYYRTNAFFERTSLSTAFQDFWTDPKYWLIQLYGKGGLGKTMFVRWLIARHAIPQLHIPVARLDFDSLNLANFAAWPWLVLVPIVEQLKTQFEYASTTNPFNTFSIEMKGLEAVLRRGPTFGDIPAESLKLALHSRGDQAPKWFQSALGDRPVLIVLDTCEEPLLHRLPAMRKMMALLENLRFESMDQYLQPCAGMRVLVSGRYQLTARGRLPEIEKRRGANLFPPVKIESFNDKESQDYLQQKRGMADKALVAAIAQKCRGNPFSLSLFADLALTPEGLTIDEVHKAPPDELVYLLDRVIRRIPQRQVRWLVRYAVIPRELTFEFVQNVLAKYLPEEASGKGKRDPQNEFSSRALRGYEKKELWPPTRMGDLKGIWEALCRYASDPSWITVDAESQVVRLQPEVVEPMRSLLRENPRIFLALHRTAERFFRQRASGDRNNWSRHIAEAMFHRFQRQAASAGAEWLKCIDSSRVTSRQDRENLASTVLNSAFLDDRGRPRKTKSGDDMVDQATLARAYFERGYSALVRRIQLGKFDDDPQSPTDIMIDNWKRMCALPRVVQNKAAPSYRRNLLAAGVRIYTGKRNGYAMVGKCLARERDQQYRLTGHLLAAGAVGYDFGSRSARHLEDAAAIAARIRSLDFPAHWLDFRFADYYHRAGLLAESKRHLVRALEAALQERSPAEHTPGLFWRLMVALRLLGLYEEMAAWIGKARTAAARTEWKNSRIHFEIGLAEAQLALERLSPLDAQKALNKVEKLATTHGARTAWAETQVELSSCMLNEWDVIRHSDTASKESREMNSVYGQVLAEIRKADFYLGPFGDYRKGALRPPHYRSWRIDAEYAGLRMRMPNEVSGLVDLDRPPREASLQVAADGFPLVFFYANSAERLRASMTRIHPPPTRPSNMDYLEKFLESLGQVAAEARFRVIERFALTPGSFVAGDWTSQFSRIVLPPSTDDPDFPRKAMALAEGLRVFGDTTAALQYLQQAEKKAGSNCFLLRQIYNAIHRADPVAKFALEPFITRFRTAFSNFLHLRATSMLEAAEYCFAWNEFDQSQSYCAESSELFRQSEAFSSLRLRSQLLLVRLAERRQDLQSAERLYHDALEMEDRLGSFEWMQSARQHPKEMKSQHLSADLELVEPYARLTLRESKEAGRFEWNYRSKSGSWNDEIPNDSFLGKLRLPYSYEHQALLAKNPSRYAASISTWPLILELLQERPLALLAEPDGSAALPWEWAFGSDMFRITERRHPQSETARYMQGVLEVAGKSLRIDGKIDNRDLQDALRRRPPGTSMHGYIKELLDRNGGLHPRVLIVQRSERDRESSHRLAGLDSAYTYERNKVPTARITELDLEYLGDAVLSSRSTVIHLITGFIEDSKDGEVRCDLAPKSFLTAEQLSRSLQGLPPDYLRPLVLVETPLPPDNYNRARQALLRNAFCTDLFDKGVARGVIGTGLFEDHALDTFLNSLSSTLRAGATLGQLHETLAKLTDAFIPPALWTLDPDLPA